MRNLIVIILMAIIANRGEAQSTSGSGKYVQIKKSDSANTVNNAHIPEKVKAHFGKNYVGIEKSSWRQEKDGNFSSSYKQSGNEYTVRYAKNGDWLSDERHLQQSDVPKAILQSLRRSRYKTAALNCCSFVKNKNYGSGVYVLTVSQGAQQHCLYYRADGRLLKSV